MLLVAPSPSRAATGCSTDGPRTGAIVPRPSRLTACRGPAIARVFQSAAVIVDGYVRCSSPAGAGAEGTSVECRLIAAWALRHGCRVRSVFQERSSAGMGDHGSLLRRAVERVESRESDGVVVARVTQLGRSLEETIAAVERIEAAGGRFVSVCDGIDLGTASGRLVLRVLLSVLEWRDQAETSPIRPSYAISCVA